MKAVTTFLITLTLVLTGATASATTMLGENLLIDPGFEGPLTFEPPFEGRWVGFSCPPEFNCGTAEPGVDFGVFSSPNNPRNGEQSLELGIYDYSGLFVGVFQEVTGLHAGLKATFSGWIAGLAEGGSALPGTELRIEFFDSASGNEIARTDDLTPTLTETYEQFMVMDIVPAGADAARVVFVLESFEGPANLHVAFLDDASFTVVPLPGALILMLGALLPLSLFRKRAA
ncbi:MAG: hypothetical protein QNJ73_13635 [Gammaproteobacteria bacterium]|nr:hypothetical protein [Gammaproteobacteria bacterium]